MWLMLSGLPLVRQTSFFECLFFDLSPFFDDGPVPAEVNVGRFQVAKAFVMAAVIVALNEGADAGLEVIAFPSVTTMSQKSSVTQSTQSVPQALMSDRSYHR